MNETAIEAFARQIRRDVVSMIKEAGDGHAGGSLSAADIIATLYCGAMRIDPSDPRKANRDRFILSKGHSCPALYAALARRGFFPVEFLSSLRRLNSILQGHPDMNKTPGLDATTGSLGHGLAIGAGMAAAASMRGLDYDVFVLLGDGELDEGLIWESASCAAHRRLGHLIAFVDNNGLQADGSVTEVSGMTNIAARFAAFGWRTEEIDGHDVGAILGAIERARESARPGGEERPTVIIAHTIKGKGVPFMEGDPSWHKRVPTDAEYAAAMAALGSGI
jgi:transketolase